LELTKNGIQKTIYAKAGEVNSRALIATLTQNGKVYNLTDCSAIIFLENGDNFEAEIVGDTIKAIIPNAFPEPQIRVCELRLSRNNSESVLYSPMFELVFEDSLGNKAEGESLENGVQYVIKQEHDNSGSHTIDMVSGLRNKLDLKASSETVIQHYEEFSKGFNDRDAAFNFFVERTDANIINLQTQDNEFRNKIAILEDKAHRHSNKSVLDNLSDSNGKLLYNGKVIEGGSSTGSGLPAVSEADNGKFLVVENGAWAAVAVPSAEEAVF
jgi:hypothetical protein